MNLNTRYLGFELPNPLMPGASPLADELDTVKRLEDAGAAAIVLRSLFEEQINAGRSGVAQHLESHAHAHAEATTYFPQPTVFPFGPDAYLEQIRKIRAAVKIPVIGSLNGVSAAGWLDYALQIQQAGVQALEINFYHVATDLRESGSAVENRIVEIVRAVRSQVTIPLAVKLSPFFSSVANLAARLDEAGADGLVLFNRFYQPDFDIDNLDVVPRLRLSDSSELLLRLHWLSLLSGRIRPSLAVSGGVHTAEDAIKALMAGAHSVQMVSALLHHGPGYLRVVREAMVEWMEKHEYTSVRQMQGSMSLERCPDPAAFERGNYAHVLQTWKERLK